MEKYSSIHPICQMVHQASWPLCNSFWYILFYDVTCIFPPLQLWNSPLITPCHLHRYHLIAKLSFWNTSPSAIVILKPMTSSLSSSLLSPLQPLSYSNICTVLDDLLLKYDLLIFTLLLRFYLSWFCPCLPSIITVTVGIEAWQFKHLIMKDFGKSKPRTWHLVWFFC